MIILPTDINNQEKPDSSFKIFYLFIEMHRLNEPTNNINEESDLEEETIVVKEKGGGDRRSKLTLEIKESLQTYVDLELNINVDVASSTIDRAHREFYYTPKRVTLVPEQNNYATSFRKLEVDNDDKNFVFLDEVGVAIVRRLTRGRNMRCESAYLYEIALYRIKYLPPYSPFLNRIENVPSDWKKSNSRWCPY
ncbi:hypothetical protein CWI38_0758p0020 [Hamiltosporidium tvaerminnensis]|uniref:Tc1-like transposase DDE domain-containing protein n=1 Tax=Hamiltosporidium tvaerminnensis TaxID=1176355 RepID=A0A4Q9LXG8_9MICR|nr:hypothetical protein CWI38_0758p0020 [Hamiltosporidium tvaerminnensis]